MAYGCSLLLFAGGDLGLGSAVDSLLSALDFLLLLAVGGDLLVDSILSDIN